MDNKAIFGALSKNVKNTQYLLFETCVKSLINWNLFPTGSGSSHLYKVYYYYKIKVWLDNYSKNNELERS